MYIAIISRKADQGRHTRHIPTDNRNHKIIEIFKHTIYRFKILFFKKTKTFRYFAILNKTVQKWNAAKK